MCKKPGKRNQNCAKTAKKPSKISKNGQNVEKR